jgi:benzodiazapine receptor
MSTTKSLVLLRVTNILFLAATIVVNGLANTLALGGRTTGEISDLYPTLITPAGYVFSIWGLIYALLVIFIVFQALPSQREKPFLREIGFLFVLSSVLNMLWLFLWHYGQIALSVAPMFGLLAMLIAIYLRLRIGKSDVSLKEKLCVHLPFSVYLGWITVASIVNVAAALVSVSWDGLGIGEVTWGILVIVIAMIITLAVTATRRDIAYSLVIVWALVGIIVKQSPYQNIVVAAEISAIIIAIALTVVIIAYGLKR